MSSIPSLGLSSSEVEEGEEEMGRDEDNSFFIGLTILVHLLHRIGALADPLPDILPLEVCLLLYCLVLVKLAVLEKI